MKQRVSIAVIVFAILSACGGGGGGFQDVANSKIAEEVTGNFTMVGRISATKYPENDWLLLLGNFNSFDSTFGGQDYIAWQAPGLDSCGFVDIPNEYDSVFSNMNQTFAPAGEVLPVTAPYGTLVNLANDNYWLSDLYFWNDAIPENTNLMDLTIDITGDVFPAFENIEFPAVDNIIVQAPTEGQPVTATTEFLWTPGSNPNSYISFYAWSELNEVEVRCEVVDDGQFVFPIAIQEQIGSDFMGSEFNMTRYVDAYEVNAGAILKITSGSSVYVY